MDVTQERKEEIERRIVKIITSSLEKNSISEADLPTIAQFVLENLDGVTTNDQLFDFLSELSLRWPIFENVELIEKGQMKEQKEDQVAQDVLILTKSGKIDEALNLAKKTNQ